MKKFLKLFFVVLIVLVIGGVYFLLTFEDKTEGGKWTKITDEIYLDKSSITKERYSTKGWFKIYDLSKTNTYQINKGNYIQNYTNYLKFM